MLIQLVQLQMRTSSIVITTRKIQTDILTVSDGTIIPPRYTIWV